MGNVGEEGSGGWKSHRIFLGLDGSGLLDKISVGKTTISVQGDCLKFDDFVFRQSIIYTGQT